MARYTGPVCRLCRRAGEKLFLKGERCYTPKCAVDRRRRPPGDNLPRRRRLSDYGIQLREKQKARRMYGVLERQFRKYFHEAAKRPGVTGETLMEFLERRFDNVVFRLGFAESRAQARQLVLHAHFTVNGRKINIPSYRVRPGDEIKWKESVRDRDFYKAAVEGLPRRPVPSWLELDLNAMAGRIIRTPEVGEMENIVDTRLIVEHYSR